MHEHEINNNETSIENETENSGIGKIVAAAAGGVAVGVTVGTFLGGKIKKGFKWCKDKHEANSVERATKRLEKETERTNKKLAKMKAKAGIVTEAETPKQVVSSETSES